MNSGKPSTGLMKHLLLQYMTLLLQNTMDGLHSNNTETVMNTPNSPTPTVPSKILLLALWIALHKDLTSLTGASAVVAAIVNITHRETGAITSVL